MKKPMSIVSIILIFRELFLSQLISKFFLHVVVCDGIKIGS